jgi:hypothetical protein
MIVPPPIAVTRRNPCNTISFFRNVLDDVEGACKVEGIDRWYRAGIHLH